MYAFPVPYLKVLLYNANNRPLVGQDCQGQRGNVIFHLHMCKAEGVGTACQPPGKHWHTQQGLLETLASRFLVSSCWGDICQLPAPGLIRVMLNSVTIANISMGS